MSVTRSTQKPATQSQLVILTSVFSSFILLNGGEAGNLSSSTTSRWNLTSKDERSCERMCCACACDSPGRFWRNSEFSAPRCGSSAPGALLTLSRDSSCVSRRKMFKMLQIRHIITSANEVSESPGSRPTTAVGPMPPHLLRD